MATTFRDMQGTVAWTMPKEHDKADKNIVSINISDVDGEEPYPERVIVLQHPRWFSNVGRGNSIDTDLMPQPHNTWFASRVMSRHHATLSADPEERLLFITDAGSMHGTFINGDKITLGRPQRLLQGDIITFGSQVVRGDDTFAPLKVSLHFDWSENEQILQPKIYHNSFTADYSEEDVDMSEDDEIQIIRESVKQPSVEILEHGFEKPSPIPTSPSVDSERSLPSSESDPTSPSLDAVEVDDVDKDHTMDHVEQNYRSNEVETSSVQYAPTGAALPFIQDVSQQYYTTPFFTAYNAPTVYPPPPPTFYHVAPPSRPAVQAPLYLPDPTKTTLSDVPLPRSLLTSDHTNHSLNKKRKADEISNHHQSASTDHANTTEDLEIISHIPEQPKLSEASVDHVSKPTNAASITIASITHPQPENLDGSNENLSEPSFKPIEIPRESVSQEQPYRRIKKAKTKKSSSATSQVVKYAATAFAGATIGAIGAVFGLAALPHDFIA